MDIQTSKPICLIAGAGRRSTNPVYDTLHDLTEQLSGHEAHILMNSIPYHVYKSLYPGWHDVAELLLKDIKRLLAANSSILMIANNTLHKSFDMIEAELPPSVRVIHAVRETCKELANRKIGKALFLGTKFTMEDDYFTSPLRDVGIDVLIPASDDIEFITQAQSRLLKGPASDIMKDNFRHRLAKYECDTIVLACTELPLAIDDTVTCMGIINPVELQCRAAVNFSLGLP